MLWREGVPAVAATSITLSLYSIRIYRIPPVKGALQLLMNRYDFLLSFPVRHAVAILPCPVGLGGVL